MKGCDYSVRMLAGWILERARSGWDVGVENDPEPVRRFETFTADLNRMAQWLIDCRIRTVVMESTGVYWIPACQILEDRGIEVLLANPRYAKNVSGRKTDALDCQWLRTLHCYGLLPQLRFDQPARLPLCAAI